MVNPWDENALLRHKQVITGRDITFSKLMVPELLKIITSITEYNKMSILEIGCGTGVLTQIVSKYVQRIVGIDSSEEACKIARGYINNDENATILTANVEDLNSSHLESFDIALAHMVFHTISDLPIALKNVERYLRWAGYFVFSIPHPCFFSFYKAEIGNSDYNYINQSTHKISFTISNDLSPLPEQVPYFHRPLSYYCSQLCKSGFYIEQILEPFPSNELLAEYSSIWNSPRYMIFVCRKKRS